MADHGRRDARDKDGLTGRIVGDTVEVLRVIHGARQWP